MVRKFQPVEAPFAHLAALVDLLVEDGTAAASGAKPVPVGDLVGALENSRADPLRDALMQIPTGAVRLSGGRHRGMGAAKDRYAEVCRLLQSLADEGMRLFGDDVWIKLAVDAVEKEHANNRRVVLSDGRYPSQADAVRRLGFVLASIERPGFALTDSHSSENSYAAIDCDYRIVNDSTIADLHSQVDALF